MKYRGRLIFSIPLALAACDNKGSLGEFADEGSAGDGTDSGGDATDDDGPSTATSTGDGDGGTQDDDSSTQDGGSDSTDDGDELLCVDGSCAVSCAEAGCGPLDQFGADGCQRPSCQQHDECGADERCYLGDLFGSCVSSGWSCSLDPVFDNACVCGGTADCGGGYCVDAEDYPQPAAGPSGPSRLENGCAPDDGPAKEILIGLVDGSCDAEFDFAPALRFSIWDLEPGTTATFEIGNTHTGLEGQGSYLTEEGSFPVRIGTVTISEWGLDAGIAGSYEIFAGETETGGTHYLVGTFDNAQDCDGDPACG